jgi:hypothetical protein
VAGQDQALAMLSSLEKDPAPFSRSTMSSIRRRFSTLIAEAGMIPISRSPYLATAGGTLMSLFLRRGRIRDPNPQSALQGAETASPIGRETAALKSASIFVLGSCQALAKRLFRSRPQSVGRCET